MGGSPDDVGEVLVTYVKLRKSCRMSSDVGETTEGLENEQWRRGSDERVAPTWNITYRNIYFGNKLFSLSKQII